MGAESKVFSYSEVSAHNTSADCWVIINGKVYNVTSYLSDHPGGDDVILGQAGKDASEEFEDVGHGSAARLMLDEFYVGEVDSSIKPPSMTTTVALDPSIDKKDKTVMELKNYKLLFFLLALVIIGLGLGIQLFNFSS